MNASTAVRTGMVAAALMSLVGCGLQPQVVRSGAEPALPASPSQIEPSPLSPSPVESEPSSGPTPSATTGPTVPAQPSPTPTRSAALPTPTATPRPTLRPSPSATPTTTPSASPTSAPKRPRLPPDPAKTLPGAAPGTRGVVYLTFDDGPSLYTATYLSILRRLSSTATFFQLGMNVPAFPSAQAAIRAEGSSIGNHTYDHRDLTLLTKAEQRAEWQRGPRARCGRPPYGATNAKVAKVMHKLGLRQMLWTVDTVDWSRPGAEIIYRRGAGAAVHNGSIVLMHDGGGDRSETVQALPRIINELHRRGYVIRRLPGC